MHIGDIVSFNLVDIFNGHISINIVENGTFHCLDEEIGNDPSIQRDDSVDRLTVEGPECGIPCRLPPPLLRRHRRCQLEQEAIRIKQAKRQKFALFAVPNIGDRTDIADTQIILLKSR